MQEHDAEQHDKGRHKVDEHGSRAHTHTLDGVGVEQAEHIWTRWALSLGAAVS